MSDETDDEDEAATRAVPREAYFRNQDAHVVVGNDAVGDDATLAVGPEDNEARSQRLAPFAQTMFSQESAGAFPPPPAYPHSQRADGPALAQHQGSGWHDPQQQVWNPNSSPIHPAGPPQMVPSSPEMAVPQSARAVGPMGQSPMQGYPGQYPGQLALAQQGAPFPPRSGSKVTKQHIVLAVVGVICVTIFITGVVLFATTKF